MVNRNHRFAGTTEEKSLARFQDYVRSCCFVAMFMLNAVIVATCSSATVTSSFSRINIGFLEDDWCALFW